VAVEEQIIHNYLFSFITFLKHGLLIPAGKEQGIRRKGGNLSGKGILQTFYIHCNLTLFRLNEGVDKATI